MRCSSSNLSENILSAYVVVCSATSGFADTAGRSGRRFAVDMMFTLYRSGAALLRGED